MQSDGGVAGVTNSVDSGADIVSGGGQVHVWDCIAGTSTGYMAPCNILDYRQDLQPLSWPNSNSLRLLLNSDLLESKDKSFILEKAESRRYQIRKNLNKKMIKRNFIKLFVFSILFGSSSKGRS